MCKEKSTTISDTLTKMLTARRLQQLLTEAQAGRINSMHLLCKHFQPLIRKEAHRQAIYSALDEDAENIAWE